MKKLFATIAASYRYWKCQRRMARAARLAAKFLRRRQQEFSGALDAVNAWPTTGPTGNGNVSTGQYVATGTGTTLIWGTTGMMGSPPPTGFLTINSIKQRTITELTKLPNGDGLTAGTVQLIDGMTTNVEVRDDETQVTTALTVGSRVYVIDNGGLVPGGARGAQYRGIMVEHDWDSAPKTPAGRVLAIDVYLLIT